MFRIVILLVLVLVVYVLLKLGQLQELVYKFNNWNFYQTNYYYKV